jgi:hypothetical protein
MHYKRHILLSGLAHFFFCCILTLQPTAILSAQTLEEHLRQDIEDGRLDDFSKIEAAFILSGVDNPDSLRACVRWHDDLVGTIENFRFQMTDRVESARKVFGYLHGVWLKKYETGATTLLDIKDRKTFNCVSDTILFNLTCERLGWDTEAFETPSHVYSVFEAIGVRVTVENTSAMGFDIMGNLAAYSRYLAQFYPENRAVQIGFDRLYAYENGKGRPIDNTELLGLLAYNRAYFCRNRDEFARAFDFVLFAQKFNADSRSNVDFEIGLYGRWGKNLFDRGLFEQAFEVCAGGFRRHPEVEDFRLHLRAVFFQILQSRRGWGDMRPFVDAVIDLDASEPSVLGPEDIQRLKPFLEDLEARAVRAGDGVGAGEIRIRLARLADTSKN